MQSSYPLRRALRRTAMIMLAAVTLAVSVTSQAAWPEKPIQIWIPFAAGGATQALMGWIGRAVTEDTGQSLVPNYRGGMGGTIAAETAFRTAPDGYNLLMGSTGALAVGPAVMKVGFDPIKDFSPIALIATTPYVLVVNSRRRAYRLRQGPSRKNELR
jgi:tripartite-type tricarboxylate transporter receptor subunit TctC